MVQVRGRIAVAVLCTTILSSGAVTVRRAGAAEIRPHVMKDVRTPALRGAEKPRKRAVQLDDDDVNKDLDRLQARIDRLWIKVENLETALLRDTDTTPERETQNA